ncbi:MAG: carboxypeptidase regulatory-like domain-containing protein [Candidatus Heimdallarchaeaceae archaeon]
MTLTGPVIIFSNTYDRDAAVRIYNAAKDKGLLPGIKYSSEVIIPFGYPYVIPDLFYGEGYWKSVVIVGGHTAPENTGNLVSPLLTDEEKRIIETSYGYFEKSVGIWPTILPVYVVAGWDAANTAKAVDKFISEQIAPPTVPTGEAKGHIYYFDYPRSAEVGKIIKFCDVGIKNIGNASSLFRFRLFDRETKQIIWEKEETLAVGQEVSYSPSGVMPNKDFLLKFEVRRLPESIVDDYRYFDITKLVAPAPAEAKGDITDFDYTKEAEPGKVVNLCWMRIKNIGETGSYFMLRVLDTDTNGTVWSKQYYISALGSIELFPPFAPTGVMPDRNWNLKVQLLKLPEYRIDKEIAFVITKTAKPTKYLVSLEISPSLATVPPGESKTFSAFGRWSDGTSGRVSADWSISPTVGTLSPKTGETTTLTISPTASGTATIIATANGVKGTATVKIEKAIVLESLTISPSSMKMTVNESKTFGVTARYSDGSERYVEAEWSVEPLLGTFNPTKGITTVFTAQRSGKGRIIAKADGILGIAEIEIESKKRGSIIGGTVLNEKNKPIPDAKVEILGTNLVGTTDFAGMYSIAGITPGKYKIKASKSGYADVIVEQVVLPDKVYTINFKLRKAFPWSILAGAALAAGGAYLLLKPKGKKEEVK